MDLNSYVEAMFDGVNSPLTLQFMSLVLDNDFNSLNNN